MAVTGQNIKTGLTYGFSTS